MRWVCAAEPSMHFPTRVLPWRVRPLSTISPMAPGVPAYEPATLCVLFTSSRPVPRVLQADFSRGYGTVLDSGTTFTYLPTSAYNAFLTALNAAIQPANLKRASGKDPTVSGCPCFVCIVLCACVHSWVLVCV